RRVRAEHLDSPAPRAVLLPCVDEQVLAAVDDLLPLCRLEAEGVAADLPGDALVALERQLFELDTGDPGLETGPPEGRDRLATRNQLSRRREQLRVIRVDRRSRRRVTVLKRRDEDRPRPGKRTVVHAEMLARARCKTLATPGVALYGGRPQPLSFL